MFKPPKRGKGSCRICGGQAVHHGAGPELLPSELVDLVVEYHSKAYRRCSALLKGEKLDS